MTRFYNFEEVRNTESQLNHRVHVQTIRIVL
jgi:hypothetical protein